MLIFRSIIEIILQINKILRIFPYRKSERIVLISLHKIGDTIFSFPTVQFFHKKYGDRLTIVCLKSAEEIYKLFDLNIHIVPLDDKNFYFRSRIAGYKSRSTLREIKPNTIFDITGEISSLSLFVFMRVNFIYGRCAYYIKSFYDKYVTKVEKPSLFDRIFDVVKLISPEASIKDYQSNPKVDSIVKNICIHPFAGWKAKEWNFYKFIELAEQLSKEYDCTFVSERNLISNDIVNYLNKKNIKLIITQSLSELISQIKKCDLFIGNDSGPANIASFLGKKTLIIYGPVNPKYCIIDFEKISYISKQLKCSPKGNEHYCFTNAGRDGCPSFECMNQLSVSDVLQKVTLLINKII